MDFYDLKPDQLFLVSQKALILQQDKLLVLQVEDGRWDLPGGLLEFGEDLKMGLMREVEEETGLTVEVAHVVSVSEFKGRHFTLRDKRIMDAHCVLIAFICTVAEGHLRLSDEHKAYHWAARDELRQFYFAPNSQFAIDRYLNLDEVP
jgi:8-oxo-dGTP diphosphatase